MGAAEKYKEWQERQKDPRTRSDTQALDALISQALKQRAADSDAPIAPPPSHDSMSQSRPLRFGRHFPAIQAYLRPEGQQLRQGHAEAPAAASHEANPLALLLAIAADPRNSWMGGPGKIVHGAESLPLLLGGLGRLFKNDAGWGVLKQYIDKGGTPKGLRDLLRKRGYDEKDVSAVGERVQAGTDLAAPAGHSGAVIPEYLAERANQRAEQIRQRYPETELHAAQLVPQEQLAALRSAANRMRAGDPEATRLFNLRHPKFALGENFRTAGDLSKAREQLDDQGQIFLRGEAINTPIPSGTQGQAAYQAIASRMARLMDDPNFLSIREHYLPPPVSDAAYFAEHPIMGRENPIEAYYRYHPGGPRAAAAERESSQLMDQAIDAGERGDHDTANRLIAQAERVLAAGNGPSPIIRGTHEPGWGHGPGGLYEAQDQRTAALNRTIEQNMRQRSGMAPPQSFAAAENQHTSNLNRRADQRQNPPEEP